MIIIVRITVGIAALVLAARQFSGGGGAFDMVISAAVLSWRGAGCLYPYVIAPCAGFCAGLFRPNRGAAVAAQFSRVNGLINNGDYSSAEVELKTYRSRRPGDLQARYLLLQLYHQHLEQSAAALNGALSALSARRLAGAHERIAMLATDPLLDADQPDRAREVLAASAAKFADAAIAAGLRQRAAYL